MPRASYPKGIDTRTKRAHYDVFARLRVITDWEGFADQQRERRQELRAWLEKNTKLTKHQLDNAKPVKVCNLPQPQSEKEGATQENCFIAEREAWWNHDELRSEKLQKMKADNRKWLEQRRQDVKGEHKDRYEKLCVATKTDPHFSNWKKTHDPETGKKKPKPQDWRQKSAEWHEAHVGITESPPGSNRDSRTDGIRASQIKCAGGATWLVGQPWCGVWCFRGLLAAGKVSESGSYSWLASVAAIEDRARAGLPPFRGWTTDGDKADTGDLVILFGRGVHVATVRDVRSSTVLTWEGNTASGSAGSQSNGGGSFKRERSRGGDTYGYALVA